VSNAVHWCTAFHADGLRVDAVASMLYRDYSRPAGQWIPNRHGGRENLEAIAFIRAANDAVRRRRRGDDVAEESTSWGGVTHATSQGASASRSSGTWAGCTTRWTTSRASRSIAGSTRTS
jgi:1,4-alpha-glucan branching enzyme